MPRWPSFHARPYVDHCGCVGNSVGGRFTICSGVSSEFTTVTTIGSSTTAAIPSSSPDRNETRPALGIDVPPVEHPSLDEPQLQQRQHERDDEQRHGEH